MDLQYPTVLSDNFVRAIARNLAELVVREAHDLVSVGDHHLQPICTTTGCATSFIAPSTEHNMLQHVRVQGESDTPGFM